MAPAPRRYWPPRRVWVTAAMLIAPAVTVSGCARAYQAQGGGEQVPFCTGYRAYDALREPDPADRSAVLTYVQGVVHRIDTTQKAGGRAVPAPIVADLRQARVATEAFGRAYASAQTPTARAEAVSAFTADLPYADADAAVGQFYGNACVFKAPSGGG
jgi:hypothetical protein